jgi:hypothetical protein
MHFGSANRYSKLGLRGVSTSIARGRVKGLPEFLPLDRRHQFGIGNAVASIFESRANGSTGERSFNLSDIMLGKLACLSVEEQNSVVVQRRLNKLTVAANQPQFALQPVYQSRKRADADLCGIFHAGLELRSKCEQV